MRRRVCRWVIEGTKARALARLSSRACSRDRGSSAPSGRGASPSPSWPRTQRNGRGRSSRCWPPPGKTFFAPASRNCLTCASRPWRSFDARALLQIMGQVCTGFMQQKRPLQINVTLSVSGAALFDRVNGAMAGKLRRTPSPFQYGQDEPHKIFASEMSSGRVTKRSAFLSAGAGMAIAKQDQASGTYRFVRPPHRWREMALAMHFMCGLHGVWDAVPAFVAAELDAAVAAYIVGVYNTDPRSDRRNTACGMAWPGLAAVPGVWTP